MSKVILLAGTWANGRGAPQDAWWKPGSAFAEEGKRHGLEYPDDADPFVWCTGLDGVDIFHEHWLSAAHSLIWYCQAKQLTSVNIIAHSHGGQVAAIASGLGLKIETLITVATPVRQDVVFHRASIRRFVHIYGGVRDYVQILGGLSLTGLEQLKLDLTRFQRDMPNADRNICKRECGHSDLHEAALWTREDWWGLLNLP